MKRYVLVLLVVFITAALALAQADNSPTLGDITDDPAIYLGQTVTIEGEVDDLVNVRAFELNGEGILSGGRAIIVMDSEENFDLGLTDDRQVLVEGTVMGVLQDENGNGMFDIFEGDGIAGEVDEDVSAGANLAPEPQDESASREPQTTPTSHAEMETAIDATQNVTPTAESTSASEIGEPEEPTPTLQATANGTTEIMSQSIRAILMSYPIYEYNNIVVIRVASSSDIIFMETVDNLSNEPYRYQGERVIVEGTVDALTPDGFLMRSGGLFGDVNVFVETTPAYQEGQTVEVFGTVDLLSQLKPDIMLAEDAIVLHATEITAYDG